MAKLIVGSVMLEKLEKTEKTQESCSKPIVPPFCFTFGGNVGLLYSSGLYTHTSMWQNGSLHRSLSEPACKADMTVVLARELV